MLPDNKQGAKGPRKPVRIRHGPATVTGEQTRRRHRRLGRREGRESREPEVRILAFRRWSQNGARTPRRRHNGEDPRAELPPLTAAVELAGSRFVAPRVVRVAFG